ncbi:hypothetical protein Clacol_004215 [Clathrus columnatus]|uniref:Uncharacterized protein n=1 Tax=Clathrus columnatus TaxID=1419009 RepID=A0AAV5A5U6_9AGAM|nr:hypothetical protein Clacol_004215 [Clathrus columnatus]
MCENFLLILPLLKYPSAVAWIMICLERSASAQTLSIRLELPIEWIKAIANAQRSKFLHGLRDL